MTGELDNNRSNSHTWNFYAWTNVFTTQQIKEINEFIDKEYDGLENVESGTPNLPDGTIVKNVSTVKVISYGKIKHLILDLVNEAYYTANFHFGYTTFVPYNNEVLNFNTYNSDNKDHYGWHTDLSRSATYDIKFSLLINLSTDPYEGGEFQLQDGYTCGLWSGSSLFEPGSAIMFKSYMPHRVLPVTSGTRKSLIMFISGPKFK